MKRWTRTTEKAAHMVAQDHDSDREIAAACKISERTLARWKTDQEFIARVEQVVGEYAERALRHGLARRDKRLRELTAMYDKLQQIAVERSNDPDFQKAPGGATGFLVRKVSSVGSGDNFRVFPEYELDVALVRETRGILDQVAEESGQKVTRLEGKLDGAITGLAPKVVFPFDPDILTDIELDVLTEACSRAAAGQLAPPTQEPVYDRSGMPYKLVKSQVALP
jgi:hypothetical protein